MIEDSGNSAHLPHLLSDFSTTKYTAMATSLAICQSIIEPQGWHFQAKRIQPRQRTIQLFVAYE
jgi:phosphoglycerate-specific signal transduction histidine kinase